MDFISEEVMFLKNLCWETTLISYATVLQTSYKKT